MITGLSGLRKTRRRWRGGNAVRCAVAILAPAACNAPAGAQLPCSYTVTVLPPFNGCFGGPPVPGTPVAINNLGHVLLTRSQCLEGYDDTYLWTGGPALTLIPRPAGMLGFTGADLNDNGVIVGQAHYASPTGPRAAIYDNNSGQWTILSPLNPPSGWSGATAISNNNEVCGFRSIGSKGSPVNPYQAFRWSEGSGFQDFGLIDGRSTAARDINEDGTTTVSTGLGVPGAFAYLWTSTGALVIHPPGCLSSDAGRLTNDGAMTTGGITQVTPFLTRGFLRRSDAAYVEMLPLTGATSASFLGIAECALVSGRSNFGSASNSTACVWVNGQAVDLNTMVSASLGLTLRAAKISGDGEVICEGRNQAGDNRIFRLTPVMSDIGDTTCDGEVNVIDLLSVLNTWGPCAGCRGDFDGNAVINSGDLVAVLIHWGQ